eukprot:363366-Chlamydomonas_euryale.AAC.10
MQGTISYTVRQIATDSDSSSSASLVWPPNGWPHPDLVCVWEAYRAADQVGVRHNTSGGGAPVKPL